MTRKRSTRVIVSSSPMRTTPNSTDEISQLPEPILHHIMSFLPTKYAASTSSLSKLWNVTWNSFPVLEFDQDIFEKAMHKRVGERSKNNSSKEKVEAFCNYVQKSITSRRQSDVSLQKFQLVVYLTGSGRHAVRLKDIHSWLNYAKTKNVRRLSFCCRKNRSYKDEWRYVLPESLFCSKSLEELDLFGCKFLDEDVIRTTGIGFSLRKLSLIHVRVDQLSLQNFLSSCHSVEEIAIKYCCGFETVKLAGVKMKKADLVLTRTQLQTITIEAPNLQFLNYGGGWYNIKSSIMGSDCKNLKEVMVHDTEITSDLFRMVPLKFPLIESLVLERCSLLETAKMIFGVADIKEIQAADSRLVTMNYDEGLGLQTGARSFNDSSPPLSLNVESVEKMGANIPPSSARNEKQVSEDESSRKKVKQKRHARDSDDKRKHNKHKGEEESRFRLTELKASTLLQIRFDRVGFSQMQMS